MLPTAEAWGRIPTIRQRLMQKGIGLDKGSLTAALENTDSEVRMLAASELASEKDTDAIPAIRNALSKETAAMNRAAMALDLAQLGDATGTAWLKDACSNSTLPGYIRMSAAQNMLIPGDFTCLSDVVSLLRSNGDWVSMTAALGVVPQYFVKARPEMQALLVRLTSQAVSNPAVQVRLVAANALATIGDTSAVPILEAAIAHETSKETVTAMEEDLKALRTKAKGNLAR